MKMKPSLGNYFKLPNPGLWAYFKHVDDGQSEDYRPPFWNRMDRSAVLELWQKELDDMNIESKFPSLYNFEMEMKSKVGPMSIQLPLRDRIDSIESYFTDIWLDSEPISEEALKATVKFFSRAGGIRLRNRRHTLEKMRLNTNSGVPFFTKRKNVVSETLMYTTLTTKSQDRGYMVHYEDVPNVGCTWDESNHPKYEYAAVLGWRGQEGGIEPDDVKQRVVWMMPFLLNIEELQFYQPAIEAMQKNDLIPAYISMDRVDQEVTALFDTKGPDDLVICTDFTKFDQHFNKDLQSAAEYIERALCTNDTQSKDWFRDIFHLKFNIPLICDENLMFCGAHGMGSGSGGTNFDECMSHKAMQFEAALDNHQELNPHSMAYGDDGILSYPGITAEQVVQAYTKHGQVMNLTKQYASKHDCVVLRRWHGTDYRVNGTMVGVYSTFRALGRLLAQERFYDPDKWNATLVTLRALSIIENCKWSPYFHQFIEFVIKGDKYRLGLDIPGFFDDLESVARKSQSEFTDFLGYTKTLQQSSDSSSVGIDNWEVVKYLKSKR